LWVELLLGSSSPCCATALLVVGVAEISGKTGDITLVGVAASTSEIAMGVPIGELLMGVAGVVLLISAILLGVAEINVYDDAIVAGMVEIGTHSGLMLVGMAELTDTILVDKTASDEITLVDVADICVEMVLQNYNI